MTRAIKDVVLVIMLALYLGYGAAAGIVAGVEIKKLKEETTILQYKMGVISASNNSK